MGVLDQVPAHPGDAPQQAWNERGSQLRSQVKRTFNRRFAAVRTKRDNATRLSHEANTK